MKVLGDKILGAIARDLVITIRENLTVDWSMKETVRAKLRVAVKRLLKQHGYPPDKQEKATLTVLEQAELLCRNWPEEDLVGASISSAEATGPMDDLPMAADKPRSE